jgi:hypothetical protein
MQGDAVPHHTGPEAAASDWDVKGFLGFEFEVRGGIVWPDSASPVTAPGLIAGNPGPGNPTGDILGGSENPYSYDPFGFSVTGGYRFLPFLSAGVFFDYANFQVNDQTDSGGYVDSTSQLQRQVWQLGVYGRYYLTTLSRRLHPWAELDVGPTEDTASYTRVLGSGTPETTNYYLTYWGIATALKVGLDWRLSPYFSVGPVVGYSRTFGLSGNVQVCPQSSSETGSCDTNSSNYVQGKSSAPVTTNGYGMFFGGIFLKVTLGPSLR